MDGGLLRLITCGSVDDGKSTLIGRLLYDSKSILQDQLDAIHRSSVKRGDERVDLALLTDGLRAEREQGITIDVAYRYFATPRRKFILADTPGHVQYTRNMATGASTADLAIVLIDARQGVVEQTRRHVYIARMLGIRALAVAINKMDLVGYSQKVFDSIVREFDGLHVDRAACEVTFFPVSALQGDNIVTRSGMMEWYGGPAMLAYLEAVQVKSSPMQSLRFNVQWAIRPQADDAALHDYRGYAGNVVAGELRVGDEVTALPQGKTSRVKRIHLGGEEFQAVGAGRSVTVLLEDDIDVARGDILVNARDVPPRVTREFDVELIWMSPTALEVGKKYFVKHQSRTIRGIVGPVKSRLNLKTLTHEPWSGQLGLNEIGRVGMRLASTIACDCYEECRGTGALIVIDEATNATVGAGLIFP